jgi:methyltransferase-like protein/2-polyprenyl-3-methyl-5-hydroxy-6-metoxy-1,4-benzoquinol methylase
MGQNLQINSKTNTYDEVPYESYPYAVSNPNYLMAIGTLFGMKPKKIEEARILELGCAAGGNIIPHALNYPKAQVVGVDLSSVQIAQANAHKAAFGLKNIEFHNCSITDIDETFGKFDYIICHGVISWVPELVREKIFEISAKNLSPEGIAYISYNTLPGWNMVRSIRDMMLYHTAGFTVPQEKVNQARLLLNFVKESLEGSSSSYADMLKSETELLSKQSDHYLRHDHLEEDNKQYYFADFMKAAQNQGLQYLADCSLANMYIGNMPQQVAAKLQEVDDIVRTEQYMDFITNRRFRSTLLCHSSHKLNRAVNSDDIMKFNMTLNIVPEKALSEIEIENALEKATFYLNGNKDSNLSTSSPAMKAILYTFAENLSNPLSFDKLTVAANKKLGGKKLAEIKTEFLNNAIKLVFQGYINITMQSGRQNDLDKDAPKVSKIAHYQTTSTQNLWVTSNRHDVVGINQLEKVAMRYMDGKNNKSKIIEEVIKHITNGELNISKDGVKVENPQEIKSEISAFIDQTIEKLANNAILI